MFIGAEALGRVETRLWPRWRAIIEHVETIWREPDDGIWEARGPRRHYTYSKVMAWVVFDRARAARRALRAGGAGRALDADVRDEIHREVCERGYDPERRTFTQYYGSRELDASVLNIPLVGLPAGHRRARHRHDRRGRARARPRRLRLALLDRRDRRRAGRATRASSSPARSGSSARSRATAASTRRARCSSGCVGLANDLGLLAEEYDVGRRRQVGNFPQAFSHLTLILAARDDLRGRSRPGARASPGGDVRPGPRPRRPPTARRRAAAACGTRRTTRSGRRGSGRAARPAARDCWRRC